MNQPGRLRKNVGRASLLVEAIASHNAVQARKPARIHMEHSEQTLLQGMRCQTFGIQKTYNNNNHKIGYLLRIRRYKLHLCMRVCYIL